MTFEAVPLGQHPTKITKTATSLMLGKVITKTLLRRRDGKGQRRYYSRIRHKETKGKKTLVQSDIKDR